MRVLRFSASFCTSTSITDVAGVDINLLETVDVDVGNDIGGAGVMGVDIGGAGVVCVGVLLHIGVFLFVVLTDVGVFFSLTHTFRLLGRWKFFLSFSGLMPCLAGVSHAQQVFCLLSWQWGVAVF